MDTSLNTLEVSTINFCNQTRRMFMLDLSELMTEKSWHIQPT